MRLGLLLVEEPADGGEEPTEGLDVLLLRTRDVGEKLLDTLVHNALREHLELEELSNETDETETLALGLLRDVVLVRHERSLLLGRLLALLLCGSSGGLVRLDLGVVLVCLGGSGSDGRSTLGPTLLEVFLAAVEEVLAEERAAGDRGARLGVLDLLVRDVAEGLHHLAAQPGVHRRPVGLVGRLLKDKTNDLPKSATVGLGLGLVGPREDLARDRVEVLHRKLVEETLDLLVSVSRVTLIDGRSAATRACLPAVSRLNERSNRSLDSDLRRLSGRVEAVASGLVAVASAGGASATVLRRRRGRDSLVARRRARPGHRGARAEGRAAAGSLRGREPLGRRLADGAARGEVAHGKAAGASHATGPGGEPRHARGARGRRRAGPSGSTAIARGRPRVVGLETNQLERGERLRLLLADVHELEEEVPIVSEFARGTSGGIELRRRRIDARRVCRRVGFRDEARRGERLGDGRGEWGSVGRGGSRAGKVEGGRASRRSLLLLGLESVDGLGREVGRGRGLGGESSRGRDGRRGGGNSLLGLVGSGSLLGGLTVLLLLLGDGL